MLRKIKNQFRFFTKNTELNFVLIIPILNALAAVTVNYFPPQTINPGTIRAFIILIFLVYFIANKLQQSRSLWFIYVFLCYILILVILSSNLGFALYRYMKIFISMMLFPVGFFYIRDEETFKRLNISYAIVLFIYVANSIISDIFQIGSSDYLKESFYYGSSRVNITKNMVVCLLVAPLTFYYIKSKNWNRIYLLLIITSIILVLIGIKRTAIITLILGFLYYSFNNPRQKKIIKYLFALCFLLFITSPLYWTTFEERFKKRQQSGAFDIEQMDEKESRFTEIRLVYQDFIKRNISSVFFGAEMLNDQQYFASIRMLHTDYMLMLAGGGIVGIFLFLYIYLVILRELNMSKKIIYKQLHTNEHIIIGKTLIISALLLSIAGTLHSIEIRGQILMYLGAILGLARRLQLQNNS
jgi:hypothetical protein